MSDAMSDAYKAQREDEVHQELLVAAAEYLSFPNKENLRKFRSTRRYCWPHECQWPFGANRVGTIAILRKLRKGDQKEWVKILSNCVWDDHHGTDFWNKLKAVSPFADKQVILVGGGSRLGSRELRGETQGVLKEGFKHDGTTRDCWTFMAIPK